MDFERSDFDETEVSESLHIDQLAYKDPRRSYTSEADTSLAEFEELERVVDTDDQANDIYDEVLAEVDNAAARLEKIRYRDHSESSIRDSYDEYGGYGSSYGYSQSEDNKSTGPDYNLEVSRHDDEYDEMLEQLQSQVNSLDTESDTESRSVYSAQSSNKHDTLRRQSTDLSQDLHNVKESTPYRPAPSVSLYHGVDPFSMRLDSCNETISNTDEFVDTHEKPLLRTRSTPKLSKSGPSMRSSQLSPLQKSNKWASMPWLSRQGSVTSSITSEFSNAPEQAAYRAKYRNERGERKKQNVALVELQDEYSAQSKQLAEARQTIDQLRLGASINLYGAPPKPAALLHGSIQQANACHTPSAVRPNRIRADGKVHSKGNHLINESGSNNDDYDYPSPHFARDNNKTVLERNGDMTEELDDSNVQKFTSDDEITNSEQHSELEDDMEDKGELVRTEILDLIDRIDQSIKNYKELVRMNQIDLGERENALKNLEQNQRQLEKDYLTAKSEVSEKILDPKRELSADIIRLGTDLAELKRQLEFDERDTKRKISKPSSYGSSTMNSERSRTSNETTVDRRASRDRSQSPSRIPIVPQAEAYRRNSKPSQIESPKPSPTKSKLDPKPIPSNITAQKKPQSKFSRKSSQSRINPRSLADSGFNSSYPSKSDNQRTNNLENSGEKINRELSNLQIRNEARRQRTRKSSSSIEIEVKKPTEYIPTEYISTMPITSDDINHPQTMSFGINVAPSMKTSETQTDKHERSHKRLTGKFHSMADVRPQYNRPSFEVYDDTVTDSLTDAETVIRNSRRNGSRSPKLKKSRSRGSKIDIHKSDDDTQKRLDNPELEVLTGEIKKLREQIEESNHPKPVIKKSEKDASESDSDSKHMQIFRKLRNEIKNLRDDLLRVSTPKNRSRASSIIGSDSTVGPQKENAPSCSEYNTEPENKRNSRSFSRPRGQVGSPSQFADKSPMAYVPFPVDANGMPLWLLPNKTVVHAESVPNLTVMPPKHTEKPKQIRLEYRSSECNSDVERVKSRKAGKFVPSNVVIYDHKLDQKLRKAERAADHVSRRSSNLVRSARHYTTYYGYC